MDPSFHLFEHTADIGITVVAPSRRELIQPAQDGLYAVIGELRFLNASDPHPFVFRRTGEADFLLLREYLSELLFLFEREKRMVSSVTVENFSERELFLSALTEVVDIEHSIYYREVKAITYHELNIREIVGGFEATIIVDI